MYIAGVAQDNSKVPKAADSSHTGSQRSPAAVETESHLFNSFLSKVLSMCDYMCSDMLMCLYIYYWCVYIYCMARNFWGARFSRIRSKKYFVKNSRGWTNYIKPTITIHTFIVCVKIADDIQTRFWSRINGTYVPLLQYNREVYCGSVSVLNNCRQRALRNTRFTHYFYGERDSYLLS